MANRIEQLNLTSCFLSWTVQQEEDLKKLLQAEIQDVHNNEKLQFVVGMTVQHVEEYHEMRMISAQRNGLSFFFPTWCSSFENSYLNWVAGCRPSLFVRLLYTLSGSKIESDHCHQLDEFLRVRQGNFGGELSTDQLRGVDDLQRRTILSEADLSSEMARMQEDMADKILDDIATTDQLAQHSESDIDGVLDSFDLNWLSMLGKADNLRLNTMKEMVNILTSLQAVKFLIASIKLHLSIHQRCSAGVD